MPGRHIKAWACIWMTMTAFYEVGGHIRALGVHFLSLGGHFRLAGNNAIFAMDFSTCTLIGLYISEIRLLNMKYFIV